MEDSTTAPRAKRAPARKVSAAPRTKPTKSCRCKENLLAALNLRGDVSKGNKDKLREIIIQEMK